MRKLYCDYCDREITGDSDSEKLKNIPIRRTGRKIVKFHLNKSFHTQEEYDVCKYCVIDAVKALDDRPSPAQQ